jgi:hypothetical protein
LAQSGHPNALRCCPLLGGAALLSLLGGKVDSSICAQDVRFRPKADITRLSHRYGVTEFLFDLNQVQSSRPQLSSMAFYEQAP